jgi:flagellar motor switch protein FliM
MADEVLSQMEVESLLSALDTGGPKSLPQQSPGRAAPLIRSREKVTPYDFKRPERVGKEQMRSLQSLHEGDPRHQSVDPLSDH